MEQKRSPWKGDWVTLVEADMTKFQITLGEQKIEGVSVNEYTKHIMKQKSLLHRLQTQTLPDAASPIGKVHQFSKIALTLEPVIQF